MSDGEQIVTCSKCNPIIAQVYVLQIEALKEAGLTDNDQIQLAFQVYLDLCESKDIFTLGSLSTLTKSTFVMKWSAV